MDFRRVDAQARGIKDGDICRRLLDRGETLLTAYVTNRCMPGTAAVHHGGWYQTGGEAWRMNVFGQDLRGTPNILLDDGHLPHILGALIIAGLVQVEKVADGDAEASEAKPSAAACPRRHGRPWPSRDRYGQACGALLRMRRPPANGKAAPDRLNSLAPSRTPKREGEENYDPVRILFSI